eukprot:CAMPEP_0197631558 /NCGR_PEP_ID=MMETSP1338-20131121/8684_1 /TAXON_ID=43686 ORGANISM="Pelagodinium beii, Strain RCC1491" /NCGR_SAMPLE_ID=MMETSP1338 /ASSEMBLY_ACC=CAM_ASM_000754 /LENGTH=101 /DNA_ID=CAMNT_0043203039 /DNA_START=1324 /DNA_END=1627 /DNA_ORIENTATION=+
MAHALMAFLEPVSGQASRTPLSSSPALFMDVLKHNVGDGAANYDQQVESSKQAETITQAATVRVTEATEPISAVLSILHLAHLGSVRRLQGPRDPGLQELG